MRCCVFVVVFCVWWWTFFVQHPKIILCDISSTSKIRIGVTIFFDSGGVGVDADEKKRAKKKKKKTKKKKTKKKKKEETGGGDPPTDKSGAFLVWEEKRGDTKR